MSRFWLAAWACMLSITWLLPNHYMPWTSFHFDLWMALSLVLAAVAVLVRSSAAIRCGPTEVLVGGLVLIPALQGVFGIILFSGNAWMCSAYLLGALLALLTASSWEAASPGQFVDGLFLAIGLAALATVGFQLYQWLWLDGFEVWIMPDRFSRPFGNFGQPNQAATFLLWGLVALAWAMLRGHVSAICATGAAAFLLFGVALTHSRTAWLGAALLVAAGWVWRRHWPHRRAHLWASAMGLYFVICLVCLPWLGELLLLTDGEVVVDPLRLASESRPQIWRLFAQAAMAQPWTGYGWNQVVIAQMAVAADQPALGTMFAHAHNLFLDLILWTGIPVGLFVSYCLLRWLWTCLRQVSCAEEVLLLMFVVVVANHAMLELPLHYAYMLLPACMVGAVLNLRLGAPVWFSVSRRLTFFILAVAVALLSVIVRDYAHVEPAYRTLRFEWARIKTPPAVPPDVVLLDQWHEFVRYVHFEPKAGMSEAELQWMRKLTMVFSGVEPYQKMAIALALSGKREESQLWLTRLCKMSRPSQCRVFKRIWADMAQREPLIAAVAWPDQ